MSGEAASSAMTCGCVQCRRSGLDEIATLEAHMRCRPGLVMSL